MRTHTQKVESRRASTAAVDLVDQTLLRDDRAFRKVTPHVFDPREILNHHGAGARPLVLLDRTVHVQRPTQSAAVVSIDHDGRVDGHAEAAGRIREVVWLEHAPIARQQFC